MAIRNGIRVGFLSAEGEVHIPQRSRGSMYYDWNTTVCGFSRADAPAGEWQARVAEAPTCPFCIRDAEAIPFGIREQWWKHSPLTTGNLINYLEPEAVN